jgi:hypothetical protein
MCSLPDKIKNSVKLHYNAERHSMLHFLQQSKAEFIYERKQRKVRNFQPDYNPIVKGKLHNIRICSLLYYEYPDGTDNTVS